MIEEIGGALSRAELLTSYRKARQYLGKHASHVELQSLRLCRRIVLDQLEKLLSVEEELVGGTLKEELNHFEAWLIDRALERHNGRITPAARELGLTPGGLAYILQGRHSKTLAGARRPKRRRHKSIIRRTL